MNAVPPSDPHRANETREEFLVECLPYLRLRLWHTNINLQGSWDDQLDLDCREEDQEEFATSEAASEMSSDKVSSAWSSAVTGKPQFSYAERLRLAKESSAHPTALGKEQAHGHKYGTAEISGDDMSKGRPALVPHDQLSTQSLDERNSVGSSSVQQTSASMSPNLSSRTTAGTSSPAGSVIDLPSHSNEAQHNEAAAPVVNVWEQRKKLREASTNCQGDGSNPHLSDQESLPQPSKSLDKAAPIASSSVARRAWGDLSKGNIDEPVIKIDDMHLGQNASQGKQEGAAVDSMSWPSPLASTSRRRTSHSLARPEAGLTGTPSQDAGRSSSTPASVKTDALSKLDVQLLRESTGDKQRKHGKQWVQIIPTITHTTPAPRQQASSAGRRQKGTQSKGDSNSNKLTKSTQAPVLKSQANDLTSNSKVEVDVTRSDRTERLSSPFSAALMSRQSNVSTSPSPPRSSHRVRPARDSPRGTRGRGGGSKRLDGVQQADSNGDRQLAVTPSKATSSASIGIGKSLPEKPIQHDHADKADSIRGSGVATMPTYRSESREHEKSSRPNNCHSIAPQRIISPYGRQSRYGQQWNARTSLDTPIMESTPVDLVPQGTQTTDEPTSALLWQIEFYFSHQNLQGDFFLRKSMDQYGFVPIDVVSTFNRVIRLAGADKVELIKETLHYSKALQFNEDRTCIRKAYGWEPYVLMNGQRAQELSPPTSAMSQHAYPHTYTTPPQQWAHWPAQAYPGQEAREQVESNQIAFQARGKLSAAAGGSVLSTSTADNDEDEDQSDEPVCGVVAATGLGGMLSSTVEGS